MSALTPRLATVLRDGNTIAVRGDGVTVLLLSVEQGRWLLARLADALARRA